MLISTVTTDIKLSKVQPQPSFEASTKTKKINCFKTSTLKGLKLRGYKTLIYFLIYCDLKKPDFTCETNFFFNFEYLLV